MIRINKQLKLTIKTSFWIWLVALLFLTFYPRLPTAKVEIGEDIFRLDYVGHFIFYAILITLFLLWRSDAEFKTSIRILVFSLVAGLVFASLTEISQLFIPERTFNPLDLIYNCLGIVAGVIFIHFRLIRTCLSFLKNLSS